MRTTPVQFVNESTVADIEALYARRERAKAIANPLHLDIEEVDRNWHALEQHKWLLSERLHRDVGLKVAALDYFENIQETAKPAIRRSWVARVWSRLTEFIDADGPYSLINFERVMRGR